MSEKSEKTTHNKKTPAKEPGSSTARNQIPKVKTDIRGLDEVLHGGFPQNRITLIKGSAGTGKTVLGLEFLFNAARRGEPVIFVSFEESAEAVRQNSLATGWDLAALEKKGKFFVWHAKIDRNAAVSGTFSIDSLLGILQGKAQQMGAKILMIDAIDVLVRIFEDPIKERNELYRLHDWLADQRFTTLLTTKVSREIEQSHRYEFLDYMADCVMSLDLRVINQVATRRLRIVKYRGSGFASNEYPYIITGQGNVVMPVTAVGLTHRPLGKLVGSGNEFLDQELGGGYHRGSCIVVSGPTGGGKTTLAATFVQKACSKGNKILYVSFEESQEAIVDTMLSPGIDLRPCVESGKLRFYTIMPEALVPEEHLYRILLHLDEFKPDHIVVDAVSACKRMGTPEAAFDFLVRLIDSCKKRGVTCFMTNQLSQKERSTETGLGISSLVDTLISLRYLESESSIERDMVVAKSRGSHHSNRRHFYQITDDGINIVPLESLDGGVEK